MKLNTKPLKDIEIGMPVIAAGTYFARIEQPREVKPNKKGTGNNLLLKCRILDPEIVTFDGKKLENKGQLLLTAYISLEQTADYDPNQRIKELALASGLPEDGEDFGTEDIAEYVKVKVGFRAADAKYKESNSIDRFYAVKPEDNFTAPSF